MIHQVPRNISCDKNPPPTPFLEGKSKTEKDPQKYELLLPKNKQPKKGVDEYLAKKE